MKREGLDKIRDQYISELAMPQSYPAYAYHKGFNACADIFMNDIRERETYESFNLDRIITLEKQLKLAKESLEFLKFNTRLGKIELSDSERQEHVDNVLKEIDKLNAT